MAIEGGSCPEILIIVFEAIRNVRKCQSAVGSVENCFCLVHGSAATKHPEWHFFHQVVVLLTIYWYENKVLKLITSSTLLQQEILLIISLQ